MEALSLKDARIFLNRQNLLERRDQSLQLYWDNCTAFASSLKFHQSILRVFCFSFLTLCQLRCGKMHIFIVLLIIGRKAHCLVSVLWSTTLWATSQLLHTYCDDDCEIIVDKSIMFAQLCNLCKGRMSH